MSLSAQNDIDSLQYILDNYGASDTVKVDLFNQIGFEYWVIDPIKSDQYGTQALVLAGQLNYPKGEAFAHRVIGVANWTRGNYEIGLIELLAALEIYKEINDALGQANCNQNLGLIYSDQLNYDRALQYFMSAIEIYEKLERNDRIATTYNKVGEVYTATGRYNEAYDYLIKALNIHQNTGFGYGISESNNRLGQLFVKQSKYDLGLDYLFKALTISESINDREGIARGYENIGRAYLGKREYNKAEEYFKEGEGKAKLFGSKKWLRDIYEGLRSLATSRRKYTQALEYTELYMAMKDSLFNEQMANRISEMERRSEIASKQKELDQIKQERELLEEKNRLDAQLKSALIAGIILLLISAYLVINGQRLKIKKDKVIFESREALSQAELANAQLRQTELKQELEFKNKELTSYTINFIRKNQAMEELKSSIKSLKSASDSDTNKQLSRLDKIVDDVLGVDKDWEDFKLYFENVHKDFFKNLKIEYPELGNSELKLCALVKLNLSLKEIASIMGISPDSVKTARYRLRKKLGLNKEDSLSDVIMSFS